MFSRLHASHLKHHPIDNWFKQLKITKEDRKALFSDIKTWRRLLTSEDYSLDVRIFELCNGVIDTLIDKASTRMKNVFAKDSTCYLQLKEQLNSLKKDITGVEDRCFSISHLYTP